MKPDLHRPTLTLIAVNIGLAAALFGLAIGAWWVH